MEAFGLLLHGFSVLLTWKTLALMMLGLVLGIFVGVLPGLGGPNGVAILLPLTFTMDPTSAIVMLSCIYWGALFGGAITSIPFNIPGEAWSVATTFDGYPMAQQARAAEGLTAPFTSSFIGSLVAVLLITFLAPLIWSFALNFGRPRRRHQPPGGVVGLEGPAEILGHVIASLLHRLLARHHPRRRDRGVLHGLHPRQALCQGSRQLWQGPHRGRVRAGSRGACIR